MVNPYQASPVPPLRRPPDWPTAAMTWLALGYPVAYTYVYFVAVAGMPQLAQQIVYGGGKVLQFALPLLWLGWVWRRQGRQRALDSFRSPMGADTNASIHPANCPWSIGVSLLVGLGFAALTLMGVGLLGMMWLLPSRYLDAAGTTIRAKLVGFGVTSPWRYVALALYYSIVHSFLEEYYWRWFAFRLLRRFVATVPAVAVQGAAFAAHHLLVLGIFFGWNSPLAWFAAGSVAVGGAFWAGLYERSGRLRIAWCSHTLIDLGLFAMGYSMIFR